MSEAPVAKPRDTPIAEKDRVPTREKTAMGFGALGQMMSDHGISQLANQVYNMLLGLNPAIISTVFGVMRLWDAITDPVMGSISDNTRSRFGRRRPYILVGSILCGIIFPLIWFVPETWSHRSMAIYFIVGVLIFYTCSTVFGVAFQALLSEMSPDYRERTKVATFAYFIQSFGWIIFPLVFWVAQFSLFGDAMTGIRILTIGMGLLIMFGGVFAALTAKERYQSIAREQVKVPLLTAMKVSLKNKTFAYFIGFIVFMILGNQLVNTLGVYLNIYYVFGGELKPGAGLQFMLNTIGISLSLIVVACIGKFFSGVEKKNILYFAITMAVTGSLLKWVSVTPANPWLQLIPMLFLVPGNAAFWSLIPSLRADICDDDEERTGTRSEGIYSSVSNWVLKLSFSIVMAISGYILVGVGFHESLGGDQSDRTIFLMRLLYTFVPVVSLLIALWMVRRYPLTRERMDAIRERLEARRSCPTEA